MWASSTNERVVDHELVVFRNDFQHVEIVVLERRSPHPADDDHRRDDGETEQNETPASGAIRS
jgi:hypothetical protein